MEMQWITGAISEEAKDIDLPTLGVLIPVSKLHSQGVKITPIGLV